MNQPILTKLWELLHLLFIGIVVAYGLFSRRNAELETNDSDNNSANYVSKFFPASTIFGDECEIENSCGFDENKMMHCWNDGSNSNEGGNSSTAGVFDEQYNTEKLSNSDDNFGYSVGFDGGNDGTNVVQSWNSEYFYSESVVVAQPYFGNVECGEVVGHKPLGLPVRSLKLVEREVDGVGKYFNENGSDSSLGSRRSSKRLDVSEDREFGDMDPTNLKEKFNDASVGVGGIASPSPIDWNSRFGRIERENVYGNVNGPLQFRPLSVDETKFEGLGTYSSQSTTSFSSNAGMYSSSFDSIASDNINMYSSSFDSIASDNINTGFQEEEMRQQKEESYVPALEKKNFRDNSVRRRKTSSFVSARENMIFEEEGMEQRIQRRDSGKKVSEGRSLRNRRIGTKGKHAANVRPMSVDETQFVESLSSQSSQSTGSFSANARMYSSMESISSDTIDFQEEVVEQKETSPLHTSENMNFQEENMHTSENMNFQEEDMEHNNTSYVHASENVGFPVEDLGQKKTSFVPFSEDMNFHEVDLATKISQVSSGNETMELRGKYAAVSHPSHFRPISVDETQLESRISRSLQSVGSFSSHTSNTSLRSSVDSVSSENMNPLQEGLGEKKSLHGSSSSSSSSSSSPSSSARRNAETSLQPFVSLLHDDMKSNLNDDFKSKSGTAGEDPSGNKESVMHGLHSDSDRPTSLAKALSRGKSVRTRRASGLPSGTTKDDETSSKQTDEKVVVKKPNNVDTAMRKDKMKSREPDLLFKGISKKTLDCYFPNHDEIMLPSHRKRDKPEPSKSEYKEDSDNKLESLQGSSDEDVVSEHVNDSGLDSEVDKKASEFIARFKAQIRLQKIGSIERSKGPKIFGDNNVR